MSDTAMDPRVGGVTGSPGAAEGTAPEDLLEMYRLMRIIRVFEDGAERLHREGALSGPFHSSVGQEAVAVGVCCALRRDDVITSTHRGHGHLIAKGGDLGRALAELYGRASGYSGGLGGSMHLADVSIGALGETGIVGASIFVGTGAALGFQHRRQDRVAVAFLGDGGVGQGVFHECLGLAVMWRLPVVYVCENNQYAHSFPTRDLAIGADIAAFVRGYGMPAVRVDGTDPLAVRAATAEALGRARRGDGPSFIEATCYRWRGHNLNDAHHLYRAREEVDEARKRDPVEMMREVAAGAVGPDRVAAVDAEAEAAFERARAFAEASSPARPGTVFDGVPA